jgi:hypothetical protein
MLICPCDISYNKRSTQTPVFGYFSYTRISTSQGPCQEKIKFFWMSMSELEVQMIADASLYFYFVVNATRAVSLIMVLTINFSC